MASGYLALVNGIPRMQAANAYVSVYDQSISVVSGVAANANQIQGPVTAGTSITLPNAQTYSGSELQVYLNGDRLESTFDYNYVGTGSGKTQIQMTFGLVVGDRLDLRVDRAP